MASHRNINKAFDRSFRRKILIQKYIKSSIDDGTNILGPTILAFNNSIFQNFMFAHLGWIFT